jgi:hypothetical protein
LSKKSPHTANIQAENAQFRLNGPDQGWLGLDVGNGGAFQFRLLACSAEELKTSFFQGMSKFFGGIIEYEAILNVN